ncbi:MAG: F0F1 ATP synthase subunit delta [Candidatus Acidiferrales bacterium]
MLIDWFTVGAQIVNFVILVWLMKHFLYKPILNAIDAREKRIASELADANAKKAEAEKERADFENKNKVFDDQRSALLSKATGDAKAEGAQLLDKARKDADSLRDTQAAALQSDHAKMGSQITRMATEEVFGIARKALSDLATVSLEERMGEVFTRRVHQMNGKDKELLAAALKASSEPAVVRSAFAMPTDQQAAIQNALNETFSAVVRIRFETTKEAICGIELSANGQKVGWSIATYISALDEKIGALLEAQSTQQAKGAPKPTPAPAPPTESNAQAVAK